MRATCTCTAPIMLRAGVVVCASCGARILGDSVDTRVADLDDSVLYGSRAPLPPPPIRGAKSEAGRRRWLRERGDELRAFGATRSGGKAGRTVTWSIRGSDLRRYLDTRGKEIASPPPSGHRASDEQIDAMLAAGGERFTRRSR